MMVGMFDELMGLCPVNVVVSNANQTRAYNAFDFAK